MKNHIIDVIGLFLSRRTLWRLGRCLYLKARADSPNNERLNGEELLQQQIITKFSGEQQRLVVFDVGANIGNWTLSLLQEANKSNIEGRLEVHSFEPIPSTFAVLQDRINGHPLRRVVNLISLALSSENGTADMYVSAEGAETNSLHPDARHKDQWQIQIEIITLDNYCYQNNIKIIHFLKCDTEGHDMEVLLGAKRLFNEQRIMACQFEYNHRWVYSRHYLKDVFDMFESTPYNIGKITPVGIELYHEWHPELERFFEGNYILLHSAAINWFTVVIGEYDTYSTYCIQPSLSPNRI